MGGGASWMWRVGRRWMWMDSAAAMDGWVRVGCVTLRTPKLFPVNVQRRVASDANSWVWTTGFACCGEACLFCRECQARQRTRMLHFKSVREQRGGDCRGSNLSSPLHTFINYVSSLFLSIIESSCLVLADILYYAVLGSSHGNVYTLLSTLPRILL